MIPQGGISASSEVSQQPTRTYKIDLANNRITGKTDSLEAMQQVVFKILQTERYDFDIYSANYGGELTAVTGGGPNFVQAELGRRIRAALLRDDRISDVQDMQITVTGDEALAQFTVVSQYGTFEMTNGV